MKKLLFLLFLIPIAGFSQNKKEQIATLNFKLDSLTNKMSNERQESKKEIEENEKKISSQKAQLIKLYDRVKKLNESLESEKANLNTQKLKNIEIEKLNNKYEQEIGKLNESQESLSKANIQLKESLNSLDSIYNLLTISYDELRSTNMQLVESLTVVKNEYNSLKLKDELSNDTLDSKIYLFSLSNGSRAIYYDDVDLLDYDIEKLKVEVQVGIHIRERFYIINSYNDIPWPANLDNRGGNFNNFPYLKFKHKSGRIEGKRFYAALDSYSGNYDRIVEIIYFDNEPYILEGKEGTDLNDYILYKIGFDNNINLELTKIFETESGSCLFGDCNFKNIVDDRRVWE